MYLSAHLSHAPPVCRVRVHLRRRGQRLMVSSTIGLQLIFWDRASHQSRTHRLTRLAGQWDLPAFLPCPLPYLHPTQAADMGEYHLPFLMGRTLLCVLPIKWSHLEKVNYGCHPIYWKESSENLGLYPWHSHWELCISFHSAFCYYCLLCHIDVSLRRLSWKGYWENSIKQTAVSSTVISRVVIAQVLSV